MTSRYRTHGTRTSAVSRSNSHRSAEARVEAMKAQIRNRNPWKIRLLASFLLAVMLPAAVLAAPLRYCIGQNGHRGIEFVHAKGSSHTYSGVKARLHTADHSVGTPHIIGSHCEDRQLLPTAAKPASCIRATPVPQPLLDKHYRLHIKSDTKERATRPALWPRSDFRHPDPRLVSLRTVVLLN